MASIDDAERRFGDVLKHTQNLMRVHLDSRQGKGRRWAETSLNHAAIALTVAAWQAYVEALVEGILDGLRPPHGPLTQQFNLVNASAKSALSRFNTPNAEKTREMFQHVGFDPRSEWTWTARGASCVSISQVEAELNAWLKVRHAVAHGFPIDGVFVVTGWAGGQQTVRYADVGRCYQFFIKLVQVTSAAARRTFPIA